eukprot:5856084-Amphidinium_carterae.1
MSHGQAGLRYDLPFAVTACCAGPCGCSKLRRQHPLGSSPGEVGSTTEPTKIPMISLHGIPRCMPHGLDHSLQSMLCKIMLVHSQGCTTCGEVIGQSCRHTSTTRGSVILSHENDQWSMNPSCKRAHQVIAAAACSSVAEEAR